MKVAQAFIKEVVQTYHFIKGRILEDKRFVVLLSLGVFFGYIVSMLSLMWLKSGAPPKSLAFYYPMLASSKFWEQQIPITTKLDFALHQGFFVIYGESEALGAKTYIWTFSLSIEIIATMLILSALYGVLFNLIVWYRRIKACNVASKETNRAEIAGLSSSSIGLASSAVAGGGAALGACCGAFTTVSFLVLFGVNYTTALSVTEYFLAFYIFSILIMVVSIFYLGHILKGAGREKQ